METATPSLGGRLTRWAGLGAILYVILFIVGFIVAFHGEPSTKSAPAKLIAYYSRGSHRSSIHLGVFLILIGVFLFFWFLGALRQTVRSLAGEGLLAVVTTVGGAVYGALTLAAFAVDDAIKTASNDTYHHQVSPQLIPVADDAAYLLHSFGGVGAAAMMIATSLACLQARALPRWLCWLSVAAGLSAIVSFLFIPWFVIAIWLIVAGVLVFRAQTSAV